MDDMSDPSPVKFICLLSPTRLPPHNFKLAAVKMEGMEPVESLLGENYPRLVESKVGPICQGG